MHIFIINEISATYMNVLPSYDLSLVHFPTIITFVIRKNNLLQDYNKTNWENYPKKVEEKLNLNISLKNRNKVKEALRKSFESSHITIQ